MAEKEKKVKVRALVPYMLGGYGQENAESGSVVELPESVVESLEAQGAIERVTEAKPRGTKERATAPPPEKRG